MRRFLFGVVIASVTAAMPAWALGGDREIAETIMAQLERAKSQGMLKGTDIDLTVDGGVVYLSGNVRTPQQHALLLGAVENASGVNKLVNDVKVSDAKDSTSSRSGFSLPNLVKQGPQGSTVVPASADETRSGSASDDTITDTIIGRLQDRKATGELRGFDLDVSTTNGEVWLRGNTASAEHKALIIDVARRVSGVKKVIDDVVVGTAVRQVSTGVPNVPQLPPRTDLQPVPQMSSMPVVGNGMPRPFAPAMAANVSGGAPCYGDPGMVGGGNMPVPMQAGGVPYGAGAPRYDQPYMPNYAWPSYAAYPNYAAVTYPKQYSPSAWPYIGPFYPYPQVPLGWRKVALEWDDGLWYLDFTSK
jgi:osmotically-inducible protein OsmY